MLSADDEEDFSSTSSSKLASLFGLSKPAELGNVSLTYTAPKQPRKDDKSVQQDQQANQAAGKSTLKPAKLNIIVVKPVHTYKLEGINYTPQGKLGAAVLGNVESRIFQLLLYKGQQQHVTSARITSKFQFTVQMNNYGTFYDDQSQNWSIMFEGADHAVEFAREIGLARATSLNAEEQQSPCVQELLAGTGAKVNFNDALEIQYSAKQLTGHQLDKEIDSNVGKSKGFRVKVKKDGWEEFLVGLSKGAKRLIILPPSLMGMWKEQVEINSRLALEVEVIRVKISSGSGFKEHSSSRVPSSHDSGESAFDSSADDGSIKARGASISEALTNSPKTNKASIISRMAKMGQATLPLKGAITCNPSDSEETEEENGSGGSKVLPSAKPAAKPRSVKSRPSLAAAPTAVEPPSAPSGAVPQSIAVYHGVGVPWQQAQHPSHSQQFLRNGSLQQFAVASPYGVEGQLFPVVPHMVGTTAQVFQAPVSTPPALASPDTHMAIFLSETRTHNSEVRMGVAKVADKVDQVISKLDSFQQQQQQQQQQQLRPMTSGGLDPATLLSSIQKIVKENEQLHVELEEKRSKVDELNDKVYKLLQTNQKFMEQSSDKFSQGDAAQALITTLQHEKTKLSSDLHSAVSAMSSLQAQVSSLQQREAVLISEVSALSSQLQTAREELEKKLTVLQGMENQLKESESCRQAAEQSLQSTQEKLSKMMQERKEMDEQLHVATHRLGESEQAGNEVVTKYKEQIQELEHKLAILGSTVDMSSEKVLREEFQSKMDSQKDELEKIYSSTIQKLEEENNRLKLSKLEAASQKVPPSTDSNQSKVVDEVKKVMNMVYKQLHVRFQPKSSFEGSEVRDILLSTIRDVTLYLLAENDSTDAGRSKENVTVLQTSIASGDGSKNKNAVQGSTTRKIQSESSVSSETSLQNYSQDQGSKTVNDSKNKTETNVVVAELSREVPGLPPDSKITEESKSGEEVFTEKDWLPQRPVPPPLFDGSDDDDEWLS